MTDTKEAFDQAVQFISELRFDRGPHGVEPVVPHEHQAAIRAHVAALEGELRKALGIANSQCVELAELKGQMAAIEENDTEERNRNVELQRELAAVKAERDNWKQLHNIKDDLLAKLVKERESAPKVWLWWHRNVEGKWHLWRASDRADLWQGCTMTDDDRIECVHAVPVEGDHEQR